MPNGHLPNRWGLACLCVVLDTVLLTSPAWAQNHPPVVSAGPDRSAYTGDWVTLNGSATDPDGDPILWWTWEVLEMPAGGRFRLLNEDTQNLMFLGYVQGDYLVSLTAGDGTPTGFGGDYVTIHVTPPPLRVALTATNTLLIAWPAAVTNYALQQNAGLATTNWLAVTNAPEVVGSEKQVLLSPAAAQNFYRLHKP
jgi:hypothetical protein